MWMTIILALLFLNVIIVEAEMTFTAHRYIQYDKGGKPLGSRKATINHVVAQGEKVGDLNRNVALVRMENLTLGLVEEIKARNAPALLVILPRDLTTINPEVLEDWKEIEQSLLKQELNMAIWFAFDCEEIQNIVQVLDEADDRYHLSGSSNPRQIGRVSLTNFLGSIRSKGNVNSPKDRLKNILIVANYDSYAGVPTLAFGANDNGSGLVALLQLASIFNRFYTTTETHGSYNFMFLITGAGRFNFQGTRSWLQNADATTSGVLENIDFVLCLDRLGVGNKLHLHVPKTSNSKFDTAFNVFRSTAKKFNIPFQINNNKRPSTGGISEWQHELLARKPIFAATLSAESEPNILHSKSTLFDRAELVDVDILVRNIKFIAEVLCRVAYGHQDEENMEVLTGQYEVNEEFVKHWIDYFGRTPRMSPYISGTTLQETLNDVLSKYTQDVMKHEFKFDMSFTKFYSSQSVELSAYRVKTLWFDLTLSITIFLYLFFFHITLKGPETKKEWFDALSFN